MLTYKPSPRSGRGGATPAVINSSASQQLHGQFPWSVAAVTMPCSEQRSSCSWPQSLVSLHFLYKTAPRSFWTVQFSWAEEPEIAGPGAHWYYEADLYGSPHIPVLSCSLQMFKHDTWNSKGATDNLLQSLGENLAGWSLSTPRLGKRRSILARVIFLIYYVWLFSSHCRWTVPGGPQVGLRGARWLHSYLYFCIFPEPQTNKTLDKAET